MRATADIVMTATEATAVAVTTGMKDMLAEESIAMPVAVRTAMIAIAVEAMTDAAAAEAIRIAMIEETATLDAHLVMLLQQPPMVTLLPEERDGNHMEVEATRMRDTPIVDIDR